jgi:hypothetical protein
MPHAVFAYLDPGAGSYLLQLALAGSLGAVYTIKHFWSRMKRTFGRNDSGAARPHDPRAH